MKNEQIWLHSTYKPTLGYRLRHSKALVEIVAVLCVAEMVLAAALVVNQSDAQPSAPYSASTPASKLAADTTISSSTSTPKPTSTPTVVANSSPAAVCAGCGMVQSVMAVQCQGQVNVVHVGNSTIGLGTVAGGLLGGLLGHQVGNGNGKTVATV